MCTPNHNTTGIVCFKNLRTWLVYSMNYAWFDNIHANIDLHINKELAPFFQKNIVTKRISNNKKKIKKKNNIIHNISN